MFLVALLSQCPQMYAQQAARSIFDELNYDDILEIELFTNFNSLDSLKKTNTYQGATLMYLDENGEEAKWGLKVRTRGKYRRRICETVPLKFNFSKKELEEKGLNKDDELKFVTQCMPGYEGRGYVFREYLAYQLYNILSPASFRSQLVRVRYNCTADGTRDRSWGIILEDEKTLARRLNADICEGCYSTPKERFELSCVSTASLFQYMIGNEDYSIITSKNLKLLVTKEDSVYRVAPYDFDFSGLVDASYAVPNSDYQLKSVKSRVFLGISNDKELQPTIQHFKDKKEEILAYIDNYTLLNKSERKSIKKYILSFYDSLDKGVIRPSDIKASTDR